MSEAKKGTLENPITEEDLPITLEPGTNWLLWPSKPPPPQEKPAPPQDAD